MRSEGSARLEVIDAGPQTLVCDSGRRCVAHLGVPEAGWSDRASAAWAQRLVGNDGDAAGLEILFGGFAMRAIDPVVIAVAGAVADVSAGVRPRPWGEPFRVAAGDVVQIGPAQRGLRVVLAVAGGIRSPTVLGSASSDTLSGLGGHALQAGQILRSGEPRGTPSSGIWRGGWPEVIALRWRPGPHADRAQPPQGLARVLPDSNRIGVRLHPVEVALRHPQKPAEVALPQPQNPVEVAPVPLGRGAVQLTPSGTMVVMGPDRPVTGGYPVIAVVHPRDADQLTQVPPGGLIRWVLSPDANTTQGL